MTLGFILITAAVMVVAVTVLTRLFDVTVQGQLQRVVDSRMPSIRKALKSPDRQIMLDAIARDPSLRERGMAFALIDTRDRAHPLYQSRKDFPSRTNDNDARAYRFIFRPSEPARNDNLAIVFAIPNREIEEVQHFRTMEFIWITLIVMGLVGFGAWMVIGKTLSPIGRLSRQAADASADNLSFSLSSPSQDAEMVELVDTLNGLLGRIAQTTAAKGRFYAAASHELRTPLQALTGHLELALTRARSTEEYEKVLAEAHRQTERLTDLIQDLLLLHQLDTAPPRAKETVQLASICRQSLQALQPLMDARHVTVNLDVQNPGEILSVHSHAEVLVRNLLENATKYADEGGCVDVSLNKTDHKVSLRIANTCKGAGDLTTTKLFEPFYRPDASRNSKTGGNGLGLAICKAIATANGWIITFTPTGESVIVESDFPLREDEGRNESAEVRHRKAGPAHKREATKPLA